MWARMPSERNDLSSRAKALTLECIYLQSYIVWMSPEIFLEEHYKSWSTLATLILLLYFRSVPVKMQNKLLNSRLFWLVENTSGCWFVILEWSYLLRDLYPPLHGLFFNANVVIGHFPVSVYIFDQDFTFLLYFYVAHYSFHMQINFVVRINAFN